MRYIKMDLSKLKESLSCRGYTVNEQVLREAVKFAPRLRALNGYIIQVPSEIVNQTTGYPVINNRDCIPVGFFTDEVPWDGKRHKWNVYVNGTPGASIAALNVSLYQLFLKEVEFGNVSTHGPLGEGGEGQAP